MESLSDDEEIQCMELLEANYQHLLHWATATAGSSSSSSAAPVGLYGEGCSASSSSSVNANLPSYLHSDDGAGTSLSPPVPAMPISNPLASNRFWNTIKSRPLIKTAIVRYLIHLASELILEYGWKIKGELIPNANYVPAH